jgi:hypothetical protein
MFLEGLSSMARSAQGLQVVLAVAAALVFWPDVVDVSLAFARADAATMAALVLVTQEDAASDRKPRPVAVPSLCGVWPASL